MPIQTTSIATIPLVTLRDMLSQCASFQALVGAADAAAAKASIHVGRSTAGDSWGDVAAGAARPYALLQSRALNPVMVGGGSRDFWANAGELLIELEIDTYAPGQVTAEASASVFTDANLVAPASLLQGATLTMEDGPQQDKYDTVATFVPATGQITLDSGLPGLPGVGSRFKIGPADVETAHLRFLEQLGLIAQELLALSGGGGALALRSPRLLDDWGRSVPEEEGDYIGATLMFEFGI